MAEETTLTVRPQEGDEEPEAALLLEEPTEVEPREWFRGAVPGAARSPWKASRAKIGMR